MHKKTLGEQSKEVFCLWRVRDRFRKAAGLLPNSDSGLRAASGPRAGGALRHHQM